MIKIAVASGKGGTGKTFIATNLFYSLIKHDENAVLADCDAEAPNAAAFFTTTRTGSRAVTQQVPVIDADACVFCGKCHEYCNYNAIFILPPVKVIKVIEELCHGCGACSYACKYGAITEKTVDLGHVTSFTVEDKWSLTEARMNIGVMSPVPVIKAAISEVRQDADIVIMDSPPGTSCPFIQTVSKADYVILVTEPTPFGLSDLKQSVDTLKIIGKPFGVIINRAGMGNNDIYHYLKEKNIPLLMEVPFDREIAKVCSDGKLLVEKDKTFSEKMNDLANFLKNESEKTNNYL